MVAGPVEAAALGNVLVQARALGAAPGDLAGMRALLRATQPLRRFEPSGGARRHGTPRPAVSGNDFEVPAGGTYPVAFIPRRNGSDD